MTAITLTPDQQSEWLLLAHRHGYRCTGGISKPLLVIKLKDVVCDPRSTDEEKLVLILSQETPIIENRRLHDGFVKSCAYAMPEYSVLFKSGREQRIHWYDIEGHELAV